MNTKKLHIVKIAGETEPQTRRRAARIICDLLTENDLLRGEVAMIFNIDPARLLHNGIGEPVSRETELIEL